jgi:hypothetical protein
MAKLRNSASSLDDKSNQIKRSSIGCWLKALAERLNLLFFQLIRVPGAQGPVRWAKRSGSKATQKRRTR